MNSIKQDRAQSIQIGAVILLSVAVILLSTYQAVVIPNQNRQVEFRHSLSVQNDMVTLRNEILEAKQSGDRGFAEITLGTRYPSRLFGLNPPPASGRLQAGPRENITVEADGTFPSLCPSGGPIQTRNLTYSPAYNEYRDAPEIVYENTVLYLRFDDETILLTDEHLVQGSGLNIPPLNTSYSEFGVGTISVEPIPGNRKTTDLQNANVSLPTGLSEDKWETLLEEDDIKDENITVEDGRLELNTSGQVTASCSPTGLNQIPAGGQRVGAGITINPAGPNDVEVRRFNRPSNELVEVTFNNTGNTDANVTEARIAFYHNPNDQGGGIGPFHVIDQNGNTVLTTDVLDPKEPLDPEIEFPGNFSEATITFKNTGGEKLAQQDFFIVKFVFDNGKVGTYFIDVPS